ncbi:MAG: aminoglycoside phosphotransferase [Actinomycetes bacterium]
MSRHAGPPSSSEEHLPSAGDLGEFLSAQRWFSGRGTGVEVVEVRRLARLVDDPVVELLLVTARPVDGATACYQIAVECPAEPVPRLEHARIGAQPCYDALHDRDVTGVWPRLMDEEATLDSVRFHRVGPRIEADRPSLVLTGEQSNTTLVYGDAMALKIYRQVAPGVNPDVEVHLALDSVGCPHIATPLGWADSDDGVLAFLQEFLIGGTEGWESAQASVRDLFVEADLHPSDVGSDFAGEAERLGRVTAEVHAFLREALPTSVLDPEQVAARVAGMHADLDDAVAEVPVLEPYAAGLRRAYDDLLTLARSGQKVDVQRVHGDFHLGQTLRTPAGWKILDFEGEPARPADERRALDTPLRDVAGMMRSLDYAARLVLLDHPGDTQRAYRAAEWVEHNTDAFCAGYAEASGRDPRDDDVLLRALLTQKVVYEVVYEARMRPGWLVLPLTAAERLAA